MGNFDYTLRNTDEYSQLPYRSGVGALIINKNYQVFVAKRVDSKHDVWQMPQGGMNVGETPSAAVMREIKEEIGTDHCELILESNHWYSYDVPQKITKRLWSGQYRGQKQKWFLVKFLGRNSDININTLVPEFCEWRWVEIDNLLSIVIPFKRKLYRNILNEFHFEITKLKMDK